MMLNVTWYRVYQNYLSANRPVAMLDAVQRGDVDVAIAWGPLVGYYAKLSATPFEIVPVSPRVEHSVPFAFDIAIGVQDNDAKLAAQLNLILERRANEIRRILESFGVPLLDRKRGAVTADR
jgi:mxaJ protein